MRRYAREVLERAQRPLVVQFEQLKLAIGRQDARRVAHAEFEEVRDAEFRVFSQWGEDGIIQYLIHKIPLGGRTFVEFGVEDYSESNTRFLLVNDNWSGLIIDGGTSHVDFVQRSGLAWRYDIEARTAFLTPDNINGVIGDAGFSGDIDLLSIDIDGNEYWILEALRVVSPRILIVEYNSVYGANHAVTIPLDPKFERAAAHYSHLYYGASLPALCRMAAQKGYSFVTSNSAGNNAFFVRNDVMGSLRARSAADGWVRSRFRESRNRDGALTFVRSHKDRLALIADMPLIDVTTGRRSTVREIFGVEP
jgi:hypothetical protein